MFKGRHRNLAIGEILRAASSLSAVDREAVALSLQKMIDVPARKRVAAAIVKTDKPADSGEQQAIDAARATDARAARRAEIAKIDPVAEANARMAEQHANPPASLPRPWSGDIVPPVDRDGPKAA